MKKITSICCVLFLLGNVLIAQTNFEFTGKHHEYPYQENQIKEVKEYLVSEDDSIGNILLTEEFLNDYGFLLIRKSYSEKGKLMSLDSFLYKNDTVVISRIHKNYASNLIYQTDITYTAIGRIHTSITREDNDIVSKRKYNWNTKKRSLIIKSNVGQKEVQFDEFNRIQYIKNIKKGRKSNDISIQQVEYNSDGSEVTKIYFSEGSEAHILIKKLNKQRREIENHSNRIWSDLDFGEALKMKTQDKVEKIYVFDENGLMISKSRYINSTLNRKIIYEYSR